MKVTKHGKHVIVEEELGEEWVYKVIPPVGKVVSVRIGEYLHDYLVAGQDPSMFYWTDRTMVGRLNLDTRETDVLVRAKIAAIAAYGDALIVYCMNDDYTIVPQVVSIKKGQPVQHIPFDVKNVIVTRGSALLVKEKEGLRAHWYANGDHSIAIPPYSTWGTWSAGVWRSTFEHGEATVVFFTDSDSHPVHIQNVRLDDCVHDADMIWEDDRPKCVTVLSDKGEAVTLYYTDNKVTSMAGVFLGDTYTDGVVVGNKVYYLNKGEGWVVAFSRYNVVQRRIPRGRRASLRTRA